MTKAKGSSTYTHTHTHAARLLHDSQCQSEAPEAIEHIIIRDNTEKEEEEEARVQHQTYY